MAENRRFFLLFPNFRIYEPFSVTPHQPSLSLGYIAGILHENHIDFTVCDAACENLSHEEVYQRVKKFNPDYLGLTVNISTAYAAITHALYIKIRSPRIKIIMGGPWATAQDKYLIENKYCDIVIVGEGEYTTLDLAHIDPNNVEELKKIKGISFLTKQGYYTTGRREFIEDLDSLPLPYWEAFPKKGYKKSARVTPLYPLLTSRGCPYNCRNCTKIVHGFKLRYRSIENVLKELDYLKKIGCKEIVIEDDMFNLDLPRLKNLLREIIRRNYNFKFQLSNGIRSDHMDKVLSELLYAAGTYRAALAIESGSPAVIKFLNKDLDLSVVPKTVKILKDAHLIVSGYFILGLPIENINSLIYSINYANSLDLDIVVFLNLLVFPGSRMEKYIRMKNFTHNENKIEKRSNYVYTPINFTTPNLNPKIIKKAVRYDLIKSFLSPRRFFKIVSSYTPYELTLQISKTFISNIMKILIALKIY